MWISDLRYIWHSLQIFLWYRGGGAKNASCRGKVHLQVAEFNRLFSTDLLQEMLKGISACVNAFVPVASRHFVWLQALQRTFIKQVENTDFLRQLQVDFLRFLFTPCSMSATTAAVQTDKVQFFFAFPAYHFFSRFWIHLFAGKPTPGNSSGKISHISLMESLCTYTSTITNFSESTSCQHCQWFKVTNTSYHLKVGFFFARHHVA